METQQICRTCLINDGNFFDISHTFDQTTLVQMLQDITNIQMNSLDGYTQSICFKCVAEVRRAHRFRRKCLQSNCTLIKLKTEPSTSKCETLGNQNELPEFNCIKEEPKEVENIKEESNDDCNPADFLKTEYYEEESEQSSELDSSATDDDDDDDDDISDEEESDFDDSEDKSVTGNKRDNTIIDCPLCHGIFSGNNALSKHLNAFHSDKIKDVDLNEKRQPLGYIIREKTKHKKFKLVYKCAMNDFDGKNLLELKNHLRQHMGDKPVTCTECDFRTTDVRLLQNHRLLKHTEEKKYSCSECDYSCKTQAALTIHSVIHSSERNFKCDLCSQTFKRSSELSIHKKCKHEKIKSHVCNICQKVYYRSEHLRTHMFKHTGERPHVCHHCGMGFTQSSNLNTHILVKHLPVTEIYKCQHCKFTTKLKAKLKLHEKAHFAEKTFKCPHCPYISNNNTYLKAHLMRHFNLEKKFSCNMCDYKCMTAIELKRHEQRHSEERPYSCNICSYSAKSKYTLRRHAERHNTELKYICENCPYRTNTKELLLKHLRKQCVVKQRGRPPSKKVAIIEMPNGDSNTSPGNTGVPVFSPVIDPGVDTSIGNDYRYRDYNTNSNNTGIPLFFPKMDAGIDAGIGNEYRQCR